MIYIDKILTDKVKNEITVVVKTELQGDRGIKERWTTKDVKKALDEKEVEYLDVLKSDVLTNTNPNKTTAKWIFSIPVIKKRFHPSLSVVEEIAQEIDREIIEELQEEAEIDLPKEYITPKPKKKRGRPPKKTSEKADE